MNLSKHIIIDGVKASSRAGWSACDSFAIRVRNGITNDNLKKVVLNTWEPVDEKERPYFFSGCSVPRFKVREKWNITIKAEYATAAFISADGLKGTEDMFDVEHCMRMVDGKLFGDWLEHIYSPKHHFVVKYRSLLQNCEDVILINKDTLYHSCQWNTPKDSITATPIQKWDRAVDWSNDSETVNFYIPVRNSNLSKITCPIYSQDAILKLLNVDNLIINDKKYEELRLMANSSDEENIILVMELMANADYKKSFVYLLCLLKEFNSKIIARKKEINHVNFKALLHFLDLDKRKLCDITIEQMVTGMKKHNQFTRANLQRITQFYAVSNHPRYGTHPDWALRDLETSHFTAGPVLRADVEDELDYEVDEDEVQIPTQEPEPEPEEENFNL